MKHQHKTISQIVYDKRDIAKTMAFKVDILSSRGISQAIGVFGDDIDFTDCPFDEEDVQTVARTVITWGSRLRNLP